MKFVRVPVLESSADLKKALKFLSTLLDSRPSPAKDREIRAVAAVIADYEAIHYPISQPTPLAALEFRMTQLGFDRKKRGYNAFIHHKTGLPRAHVTEILKGRRQLSKSTIARLHYGLGIPLTSLIGPNPITKASL